MERHFAEQQELNFHGSRNRFTHKNAIAYKNEIDRRPNKTFTPVDSYAKPMSSPWKKNHHTREADHQGEKTHHVTSTGKSCPERWERDKYAEKPLRRDRFPSSSPEFNPEMAQPEWPNYQMESELPCDSKPDGYSVDSDGDVLMIDVESEEYLTERWAMTELGSRVSQLEYARKSWEFEVEELKARLNKNMYRLDALEDFASSGFRRGRHRQTEGWWEERRTR